jgi:hypothetical protein
MCKLFDGVGEAFVQSKTIPKESHTPNMIRPRAAAVILCRLDSRVVKLFFFVHTPGWPPHSSFGGIIMKSWIHTLALHVVFACAGVV